MALVFSKVRSGFGFASKVESGFGSTRSGSAIKYYFFLINKKSKLQLLFNYSIIKKDLYILIS